MKIYQWLIIIFCLTVAGQSARAQAAKTNVLKPEIQNIKSKYKEFDDISPILVNHRDEPVYLQPIDGPKVLSILAFDKIGKQWSALLTNLYCGNDFYSGLEVKPGERVKLDFSWGFAWDSFRLYGLNKGKFKLMVSYRTASMKDFEPLESRVFEYSVKKDPSFSRPPENGNSE